MSDPGVVSAQMEWAEGPVRVRRLRRGLDARGLAAVDRAERALATALARRLGPSYRLTDLYREYGDSERWARDVVAEAMAPLRMPAAVAPLVDAAFDHAQGGLRPG
ncbi:MAG: hypothetical protein AVDCRST_MAG79-1016 [uncultured Thermoleophilia bacterium]|uniref:Uncharacterized protein n=1 Tax=uncultured Thermoleophilia bacterium TaxID=1497501 RepID=A0A6J4TUQ4_9ACTN|nr:MAG: hypothetical protein AVDCRST_MAG79-1016 [uncultured Thermoleophilia bacterium]